MQKLRTFARSFALSCIKPSYYAEILKAPFKFSVKFFLMVQLVAALIAALFVAVSVSQFNLTGFLNETKTLYPADLQLSLENGQLTTNQELPFAISLPESWRKEVGEEFQHIIVFTTDEAIQGAVDVMNQESLVVITQTSVYAIDDQTGGFEVYPIPKDGEAFSLSAADLDQFVDQLVSSAFIARKLYIPLLFAVVFLVMLPILILVGVVVALLYGFFVWVITKLFAGMLFAGQSLTYLKAVQVSLHSILLVNILQMLLDLVGRGYLLSGWVHLGAFLLWTGFVLHQSLRDAATASESSGKVEVLELVEPTPQKSSTKKKNTE